MNRPRTPEIPHENLDERRIEDYVTERLELYRTTNEKLAQLRMRVDLQQSLA